MMKATQSLVEDQAGNKAVAWAQRGQIQTETNHLKGALSQPPAVLMVIITVGLLILLM